MKKLDTTHGLYLPGQAGEIAAKMQKSDPTWTYRVIHDPNGTGYSFIEILDEDNQLVGRI